MSKRPASASAYDILDISIMKLCYYSWLGPRAQFMLELLMSITSWQQVPEQGPVTKPGMYSLLCKTS